MPTGYTAPVGDGEITTFNDFALMCARAFGALVELREEPLDAPLPDALKPSTYNAEMAQEGRGRLAALHAMSEAERIEAHKAAVAEDIQWRDQARAEVKAKEGRYRAMLDAAKAWSPPTPDHEGLKVFMVSQLTETIEFDCGSAPRQFSTSTVPETAEAWWQAQVASVESDIAYHEKEQAAEIARTEGRNEWLTALRKSLPA